MKPIYHHMRTYRKQSLFNQEDMAYLLGDTDAATISRHETSPAHTQILIALLYEHIFNVSLFQLFSEQRKDIFNRLRIRIPVFISHLKQLPSSESNLEKIRHLEHALSNLPN